MTLALVGTLLAVAAGSMLVGAALGYHTARADERKERHDQHGTR